MKKEIRHIKMSSCKTANAVEREKNETRAHAQSAKTCHNVIKSVFE